MIEARGLSKRYRKTVAVDDLSFTVSAGRVTGFLGPNGAGKSTTMRMIMGLDTPSAGSVRINGLQFHELAWPLREVGALLEAKAFHPGRSARNHLTALAQANSIPRGRVDDTIELVGLSNAADKRTGSFSLGMSQRLGIAAALLGNPRVLLLDEPFNGLDPEGIRWVRDLLKRLAAEGRAVFVSSHLMSEVALTASHLVVIGRGRMIAEMTTADFIAANSHRFVRVRTPTVPMLIAVLRDAGASVTQADDGALNVTGIAADAIGRVASTHQIVLGELSTQNASLEDAFIERTDDAVEYRGDTTSSRRSVSHA